MKNNKYPQNPYKLPANSSRSTLTADPTQNGIDFTPCPDEVARRAYFSYLNEGSLPGRDVQHWLEAEARLLAERNLTRTHGFHNV
jgi:hypothetical protein